MAEILLIRHSMTRGNLEGRYIGSRTDEPLCEEGRRLLAQRQYPPVDRIYVSPMKRCVETAEYIWPEHAENMMAVPGLRECDFGAFENKNYQELNGEPAYQAWIDSGGSLPFPGGESQEDFRARCREAFAGIVEDIRLLEASRFSMQRKSPEMSGQHCRAAIVAHGGTVMAILEAYGFPKKDYFDYQVKNGGGYLLTPVEGTELWNCQCLP